MSNGKRVAILTAIGAVGVAIGVVCFGWAGVLFGAGTVVISGVVITPLKVKPEKKVVGKDIQVTDRPNYEESEKDYANYMKFNRNMGIDGRCYNYHMDKPYYEEGIIAIKDEEELTR